MTLPFRNYHLYRLMERYSQKTLPLDLAASDYFRENRAIGSKDRSIIGDAAYQLIRWKGLLEATTLRPGDWEASHRLLTEHSIESLQNNEALPLHSRYSCPEPLFKLLTAHYGLEKCCAFCMLFNQRAPLAIRTNTLKIDRQTLFDRLKQRYAVSLCEQSSQGILFHQPMPFSAMKEYQEGLFEIQDEGSQLLSDLVDVKPGQHLLDYCAGAGGKSLAIAPKMQQKGQLYLHDVRAQALQEAKRRLKKAGAQNAQFLTAGATGLSRLKKKMDWVLVDAPCSGTGTLRRNPDMKWRFDEAALRRLVGQQRLIFERALSFVKPGGCIVYATCSLMPEENQQQVEHFCKVYPLQLQSPPFQTLPSAGGMDGFFGAVFKVSA